MDHRRNALGLVLSCAVAACSTAEAKTESQPNRSWTTEKASDDNCEINPRLLRRFQPLPRTVEADDATTELTKLGRDLYFDRRLSHDGTISCNSCHDLADYGADHERTSAGVGGKRGRRNSPTVYNAAGYFAQFWDGRSPTVEAQAAGPLLNPVEMAMPSGAAVVKTLKALPYYRAAFARAFPSNADPVSFEHVGTAIGAFERSLVTPGRWDDYLRGKSEALTVAERRGLQTFLNTGCMTCHTGPYLGGSMFEHLGVIEPWPDQRDPGREEITHQPQDHMVFKVPSLRNVAKTAPYFHDGSAATLDDAVRLMGQHQLGTTLSSDEVTSIVAWLNALTSPLPAADVIADPWAAR